MKYQMFFSCSCGFEVALTEGGDQSILQCQTCFSLESKKAKREYQLVCRFCKHIEKIKDDIQFGPSIKCDHCGVNGTIAVNSEDKIALFDLDTKVDGDGACRVCRQHDWAESEEQELTCPRCRKNPLKQQMSGNWLEEKEKP